MLLHFSYRFEGIVQGVGFRPFIYALALRNNLKGFVLNDSSGVEASIEGELSDIEVFEHSLYEELPPLARIDKLEKKEKIPEYFEAFFIQESKEKASKYSLVSPDFSMCEKCLEEMNDPKNRRNNYFFTNCTNCGPRYSIIKTVPYDRPNTSMQDFKMCKECQDEYENPLDRRYHAQPISCDKCGPTLTLKSIKGDELAKNDKAISKLATLIKEGKIVAMKGMGGFHLICDASNDRVIKELRGRKQRPTKPFAVMMKNINQIEKECTLSEKEREKILSKERPIVLVKRKNKDTFISDLIAPHIDRLGVFLPYTPLHVRLFDFLDMPIVATSANMSKEPIITHASQIEKKLSKVIDYYLDYDREILNASDDSVVQLVGERDVILRASRSLSPTSIAVEEGLDYNILAVGAHQKNSIAFYLNNQIILSPFIGDLDNIATMDFFEKTLDSFKKFYDFNPDVIVGDMHPYYASTKWAHSQNKPFIQIQHHYAHVLSCMFEHNLDEKVLGIAWDGTGYGDDGTIWGGEFLICDRQNYQRVASFEPFLLLGGEASIKDIRRVALSMILDCKDEKTFEEFYKRFSKSELSLLKQMHQKKLNSPTCSAVGRLFDAVAAICGVCEFASYDGESGLMLEGLYDKNVNEAYEFYLDEQIIRYKHTLEQMLKDKNPTLIASKFLNALANIALDIANKYNLPTLVVGGVFQNRTLLELLLKRKNDIIFQEKFPSNDGSIAVGQLSYVLKNDINIISYEKLSE